PVASPAAHHIGADHPVRIRQRLRKVVEVASVAGETVGAHEHAGVVRIAPLHVPHSMPALRVQAEHRSFSHRGHGWGKTLKTQMNADKDERRRTYFNGVLAFRAFV